MILFQASASVSSSSWPGSRDRKDYAETVRPEFCSFNAVIPKNGADQLTPAAVRWKAYRPTPTQWHVIPASMADEVNLQGLDFGFETELEAVLARYFCKMFMEAVGSLVGKLEDGIWEVPVTLDCSWKK